MTRQQFIDRMTVELTKGIDKVIDQLTDDEEMSGHVGWFGEDLSRLMAKSAAAVLEATLDVQATMEANGVKV